MTKVDRTGPFLVFKQVSFLDHPNLIGTALFGVKISPANIADRLGPGCRPEVSFDDQGFYEFVGVETQNGLLGFRQHFDQPKKPGCLVSCFPTDGNEPRSLIALFCGLRTKDVTELDGRW